MILRSDEFADATLTASDLLLPIADIGCCYGMIV